MSWAKFDDGYPSHPKMLAAGLDALGFDVAGICYCSRYLTDGFIADAALPAVYPPARSPRKLADKLVAVGRWEREDGGYRVRDYLDYNPKREEVEREREQARVRMRERRKNRSRSSGEQQENFGDGSGTPTRPGPSRPSDLNGSSPPTNTNGHGGGVDTYEQIEAVRLALDLDASYDPADIEGATALLRKRLVAGERPTSPVAWTEQVIRNLAQKRKAAAKADEPKRVVFDDGSEMVWAKGRWWEPEEWDRGKPQEEAP